MVLVSCHVQRSQGTHTGLKGTSRGSGRCRIVVAGTLLQRAVVPGSAAPFDFQAAFGLSNQTVCVCPLGALRWWSLTLPEQ